MTPALTTDQWRHAIAELSGPRASLVVAFAGLSRHGKAAVCLHGTPEGFTQEDIRVLTRLTLAANPSRVDFLATDNLAGRIAALLPPETP